MKDFLQRNVTFLSAMTGIAFVVIFILLALLIGARELQQQTLERVDRAIVDQVDLPGRKNQISERSKKEINTLLEGNTHIIGGWATKLNYEKTENPIIYYFVKDPVIQVAMDTFAKNQSEGRGRSSAELNADSSKSLRNSEEAKSGLIKCGPLATTNIGRLAPGIDKVAKGVCRATIPPFDENVSLAIVVVLNIDASTNSPDIQEVRRTLLQLQIDIFNRDFQGRETWAHP